MDVKRALDGGCTMKKSGTESKLLLALPSFIYMPIVLMLVLTLFTVVGTATG
nr:hypothetical protein [Gammaproteobacteria bacterium]